ncbi:MAG: GYD domain-containing protein [Mycobacterium sp.]|nr:GYD domain-containing protein [Mycobacterium sp.]
MPAYLYELAYTAESIAAQIKDPRDRIEVAAKPVLAAVGGKLLGGGYTFGDFDVTIMYEAPDDESAAAVALAVAAGGAIRAARTTKLLDGAQWVASLHKAQGVVGSYRPAR